MTQRTRIKICGISEPEQVENLVRLGVDAIGLVFAPASPRYVTPERASEIAAACPPLVTRVGLFRNASAARVSEVCARVPLDLLQFHGSEDNEFAGSFDLPYIRAIGLGQGRGKGSDEEDLPEHFPDARALLLDSHAPGAAGGSGKAGNWGQIRRFAENHGMKHWILAGGLHPGNVAEAIQLARPFAVDVSSGVESNSGSKELDLIQAFVQAVRAADGTC